MQIGSLVEFKVSMGTHRSPAVHIVTQVALIAGQNIGFVRMFKINYGRTVEVNLNPT